VEHSTLCPYRLSRQGPYEVVQEGIKALRIVHEKGVADVFEDFHARAADSLLHVLTDVNEGTLRRRDDQCGPIDFCQRGPVVGGEIPGPNRDGRVGRRLKHGLRPPLQVLLGLRLLK